MGRRERKKFTLEPKWDADVTTGGFSCYATSVSQILLSEDSLTQEAAILRVGTEYKPFLD